MSKTLHPQIALIQICDDLLRSISHHARMNPAAAPAAEILIDRVLDTRTCIRNPNQPIKTK